MKTITSKKYNVRKIANREFIGNCINGLDDPYFQNRVADDATILAQLIERGQKISEQDFLGMAVVVPEIIEQLTNSPNDYEYYYESDSNIVWFYDKGQDVEYFYA